MTNSKQMSAAILVGKDQYKQHKLREKEHGIKHEYSCMGVDRCNYILHLSKVNIFFNKIHLK